MKKLIFTSLVTIISSLFLLPVPVFADGIIIPDPPRCDPLPCPPIPVLMEQLIIKSHQVTVEIVDQIAFTKVSQIFYNPNDWTIEGSYIFPIPLDATINSFKLWIDHEPISGKVMNAEEARQIYE